MSMPLRFFSTLIWSQRRLALWIAAILIVFATVLVLKRGDISNYLTRYENRNRLREEVELLQLETQQLEKKGAILEKGGYEIEKVAREQFRMSRPGEHVLYLDSPSGAVSTETRTFDALSTTSRAIDAASTTTHSRDAASTPIRPSPKPLLQPALP